MCWLENIYSFMVPVTSFLQVTLPAEGITRYVLRPRAVCTCAPWCVPVLCVVTSSSPASSGIEHLFLFVPTDWYITDTAWILSWHFLNCR